MNKISGPPGTGKSTALLEIVSKLLSSGVAPDQIVFVTFTRAAAYEARDRACAKFGLSKDSLPYFKTNHALAYELGGFGKVMSGRDWAEIARELGLFFTLRESEDGAMPSNTRGDCLKHLVHLARSRKQSLKNILESRDAHEDYIDITLQELLHFHQSVEKYKEVNGLIDYSDMLDRAIRNGPHPFPYVIVDEAQDLSNHQWEFIHTMIQPGTEAWAAGDDDQCIHAWNGADVRRFITMPIKTHTVLGQSYRVPRRVHQIAERIAKRISLRTEKEYAPRSEPGVVHFNLPLERIDMSQGTWLLISRNKAHLDLYALHCAQKGLLFKGPTMKKEVTETIALIKMWETLMEGKPITAYQTKLLYGLMSQRDRVARGFKKVLGLVPDDTQLTLTELKERYGLVYTGPWQKALDMMDPQVRTYIEYARNNEPDGVPRIEINTIHGVKGKEADNVVLCPDMTHRTYRSFETDPDSEHRVFYVAVTRAKHTLYILPPCSHQTYPIPHGS